jgi:hypothetical protein
VYPNAFAGVQADIRYTYTKGAFEQDVILRETLPSPAEWGFNPAATRLDVWTEFVEAADPETLGQMEMDGMTDNWFNFGEMRLLRGSAFSTEESATRRGAPVAKSWIKQEGRNFLVESVRYTAVEQELAKLPPLQANLGKGKHDRVAFIAALKRPPLKHEKEQRIQIAKADLPPATKGLVLDYVAYAAGNNTNASFRADTTYLISGVANFYKTTTWEGGTVLKYVATNNAVIQTWSNTIFKTSAYRPAIFTSRNDRSVGEDLYLAGAATNYFEALAITISNTPPLVHDIRVSYASNGVHGYNVDLRDAVFTHCGFATYFEFYPCSVNNVLFYDCTTAFGGARYKATARQITAHKINRLTHDWYATNSMQSWVVFTNSLFSQITSNGLVPTTNWYSATDDSATVFKTVGASSHYLADDSPYRGAGTLEIPEWLGTNLAQRTTFAPMIWTDTITEDTTFEPVVQRGSETGDIGYHFPALDYLINTLVVTNAELTVMPGVALGLYGTNGITITGSNGYLSSLGMPSERNHFVPFYAVQEESTNLMGGMVVSSNIFLLPKLYGKARLHFTDFDGVAGFGQHMFADGDYRPFEQLAVKDCSFNSGAMDIAGWSIDDQGFTNNIFLRVNATFREGANFTFYNNYAFGSSSFRFLPDGAADWWVRDNFFHDGVYTNTQPGNGTWHDGYNGYWDVPVSKRLDPVQLSDFVPGSGFHFTNGPLGEFYAKNGSGVVNAGSRRATNAGLYWYTTQQDQTQESGSMVDIGFHYPVINSDMTYIDTDEDDLPDFYEDRNGNGTFETASETDPNNWDTMGMATKDNQLLFSFEVRKPGSGDQLPTGDLVVGPGFRIWSDTNTTQNPSRLHFYFDRVHNKQHLHNWATNGQLFGDSPNPFGDNGLQLIAHTELAADTWHKFEVCYDRRIFFLNIYSGGVHKWGTNIWRDNITEQFGLGGGNKFKVNPNPSYTNYVRNGVLTKRVMSTPSKYVWQGVIGNKSKDPSGPTVHSSFWAPLKIISKGDYGYWTGGFNEGRTEIHKFRVDKPEVVTMNFGRFSAPTPSDPYPVDIAFNSDWTRILVKYGVDNKVWSFDPDTGVGFETNDTIFPNSPTIGISVPPGNTIVTNPEDRNIAAVYYTNTEQVIVYTSAQSATPTISLVIGLVNGYSNGPSITEPHTGSNFTNQLKLCSYYFDPDGTTSDDHRVSRPVIGFQSDGKLWVGDTATSRLLRFQTTGPQAGRWDKGIIQYVAHTYTGCVDPNSPGKKRAFMGNLEFEVDYAAGNIRNAWKLVNYRGRYDDSVSGRPEVPRNNATQNGLYHVTTLPTPNGDKTYALMWWQAPPPNDNKKRMVELTVNGIRAVAGVDNLEQRWELEADGAILFPVGSTSPVIFKRRSTNGWTGPNNADPVYAETAISTNAFVVGQHPVTDLIKTNGGMILAFEGRASHPGAHLGIATRGTAGSWLWTNALSGPMGTNGNFDPKVEDFGGQGIAWNGENVFYLFRGEFWQLLSGQQASQIMHYKTNGAFVGQFNIPRLSGGGDQRPGSAGNLWNFSVVKPNSLSKALYVYTSDEWSHGLHRWKIKKP